MGVFDTDCHGRLQGGQEEQITGQTVVVGEGKRCSKDRKLRSETVGHETALHMPESERSSGYEELRRKAEGAAEQVNPI